MSNANLVSSVRAEWIKFRTVRATVLGMLTFIVLSIGLSALIAYVLRTNWNHRSTIGRLTFDPVANSLVGMFFGQFAIGVISALAITAEYTTTSIRSTFAAVPQRSRVILAKAIVLLGSVFVVSEVVAFVAFTLGQSIFHGVVPTASLGDSTVLRAVFMAGIYLTLLGLFGFAIGLLLRTTAATISVYVSALLVLPIIVNFLHTSWQDHIQKWLPSDLGASMTSSTGQVRNLTSAFTWDIAALVFALYVLVLLGVGIAVVNRRDA
jgi:ABC-type transport system involved in multi-copper enzyme maturation permease subunit